jgi:glycosyltransferase involved in cell wall biosynthesis
MARILYVVHRYAPFPGGSENYVRDMAEETLSRGHEVCVFTGEHQGDWNGVRVTDLISVLNEKWDLIVIHGGDVGVQDFVLRHASAIQSPILFMLIVPSESQTYLNAIRECDYIGCSTKEDWNYVIDKGVVTKSKEIRHGIDPKISTGLPGFREKYGIKTQYMFLSCGGYWPNKAMKELVDTFNRLGRDDVTLVLTGYDNRHNIKPEESEFVKPLMVENRDDVMSAIMESDLYIMHSHKEGFGLVLLEAMLNKTPWTSRNIAGAKLLKDFGFTYEHDEDLLQYMKEFLDAGYVTDEKIDNAYEFVTLNHTIKNTVDDILKLL